MRHSIPLADLPSSSAFMRAYSTRAGYARIAAWMHYDPHDAASFAARLGELDAVETHVGSRRAGVSTALTAQQQAWGADGMALTNSALLAKGGVYAVVTGQQTGVLGGPLYTQLKALSTVKLARELTAEFPGRRFVPLFWMASGDHDYEEIRRTWLPESGGAPRELGLAPEDSADAGLITNARDVGGQLAELVESAIEALPGGEHREAVAGALRADWAGAHSIGAGGLVRSFAHWLARLTAGTGLVIVDPQDAALMQSAGGLISYALEHSAALGDALAKRNADIRAAGFSLQVECVPGDTHLFLLDADGRRRKLTREGEGFALTGTGERYALTELQSIARSAPERFVCGVMLRPLYQNILIPPIAFIGGGAELAYRAQTTALFDCCAPACCGLKMAPALHRATATLLPAKSAELLDEQGWELADCMVPPQDLAARAALAQRPEEIEAALADYLAATEQAEARLKALAVALDPTLSETFDTLRGNFLKHVEKLEKKITSSIKQRGEGLQRRVALVSAQCWPQLAPQERVLNLLSFLPRHGFGLCAELLERISVPGWEHQVIVL